MHTVKSRGRWAAPVVASLLLAATMLVWAPGSSAQDPGQPVNLRGFATSTPAHVSALEFTGTRVANVEVAWSGAAVDGDADGLKGAHSNEMNRIVQPDKGGKLGYARGSGLEIGLATTPVDPNQVELTAKAEADSPPSATKTEEIALEGLDPLAYASLLRGRATTNANDSGLVPDVCVLGDDLARGEGFAADVDILDLGGNGNAPALDAPLLSLDDQSSDRSVTQSTSRLKLVPSGQPNVFGLMAETRQTVAPITLLQGDPNGPAGEFRVITIEVLGEWVLRVVADGKDSSVFYGPTTDSPSTPVVRILDSELPEALLLTLQDLLGNAGLQLPIDPLLDVSVGEAPRAIASPGGEPDPASKPTLTPTKASAAVDVIRVEALDGLIPGLEAADIRAGHMEVSVEVPTEGITCPIPVTKSADPDNIKINEEPDTSHIELTVHNVYDCNLNGVTLIDRIRQKDGDPDFKIVSASDNPAPDEPDIPTDVLTEVDVKWSLGNIAKGAEKMVSIDLQAAEEGGVLRDIAEAAGTFAGCVGKDASGLAISGLDLTGLSVPVDIDIGLPATGASAASTVAVGSGIALAAISLGAIMRRRSLRA